MSLNKRKRPIIVLLLIAFIVLFYFSAWHFIGNREISVTPPGGSEGTWTPTQPVQKDPAVYVNEFLSSNRYGISDEDGDNEDWIELYNPGEKPISLEGYALTDDLEEPRQWIFPDVTIEPKGYLLVFASGKDRRDPNTGYLHTNFRLSRNGEDLVLTNAKGDTLDWIPPVPLPPDITYGRDASNTDQWVYYPEPTPGRSNNTQAFAALPIEEPSPLRSVYINELLASNQYSLADEDGEYSDWIELYNASSERVHLMDYALSQEMEDLFQWRFPDIWIGPGEYLVVFATGKDRRDPKGELHTSFLINRTEDALYFRDPIGRIIDVIEVRDHLPNVSYGRDMDNADDWRFYPLPTPGEENYTFGFESIESMIEDTDYQSTGTRYQPQEGQQALAGQFILSHRSGFYEGPIYLEIYGPLVEEIRYTLDGSPPGPNSRRYTGPVQINQTTVVRIAGDVSETTEETPVSRTFFIGEYHTLPVISMIIDPMDFDHPVYGIYSTGPNASSEFPYLGANFHKDIEKSAHFELYEGNGRFAFRMNVGMKIFGGWTRAYEQKSLAIYARDSYENNRMVYPFFANKPLTEVKHVVFRTSGQDVFRSKIKDVLISDLVQPMGVDVQGYRQAVLYINGRYWGIYNMREKINRHFFHFNRGTVLDDVDILEGNSQVKHGSNEDYLDMMNFVVNNDLRQDSNYEILKTRMDVQSYMDYQIITMYAGNVDSGNIRYWRDRSPDGDGRWRWMIFDMDLSFQLVDHDTVWHMINPAGTGHGNFFDNRLIRHLLRNQNFRREFIERFAWHLKNTFETEHMLSRIDFLASNIETEMERNLTRWERPRSMTEWRGEVENLRIHARQRPAAIIGHLHKNLSLTADELALFD